MPIKLHALYIQTVGTLVVIIIFPSTGTITPTISNKITTENTTGEEKKMIIMENNTTQALYFLFVVSWAEQSKHVSRTVNLHVKSVILVFFLFM